MQKGVLGHVMRKRFAAIKWLPRAQWFLCSMVFVPGTVKGSSSSSSTLTLLWPPGCSGHHTVSGSKGKENTVAGALGSQSAEKPMASLPSQPAHLLAVVCLQQAEEGWLRAVHAHCCHTNADTGTASLCASPHSWPAACWDTKCYSRVGFGLCYPSLSLLSGNMYLCSHAARRPLFPFYLLHDLRVDGSFASSFSNHSELCKYSANTQDESLLERDGNL